MSLRKSKTKCDVQYFFGKLKEFTEKQIGRKLKENESILVNYKWKSIILLEWDYKATRYRDVIPSSPAFRERYHISRFEDWINNKKADDGKDI